MAPENRGEPGSDDYYREVEFTIPSDIEFVPMVEAALTRLCHDLKFSDEETAQIAVSVIEGVMNAIKHGNKYDLKKPVRVRLSVDKDQLTISIKDEGEGFQPEEVANPLEGENLFRDHGRGILMMRAYMDEVYHSEKGTRLTMSKKLPR
ncbi:MAG: hypothetical protein KatS3mg115_1213 [Candidatus Poribacteria bacterium]|nr:MAG: hypothetical protein KatS3mg115_1213 [Candidatus Poribacteria bacterium]